MPITEKVSETVHEWKDELRDSVERLKGEVAELKDKVRGRLPFGRRRSDVPVRYGSSGAVRDAWSDVGTPLDRWLDPFSPMGGLFDSEWPRIDVRESDDEVRVEAELPGVDEDDLDVRVGENALTLRGERKSEREERGSGWLRHECFYGSFHRTIPLPYEIDGDRVEATFRKGVLRVRLPKSSAAREKVRKIPVRSG